jgi:hypothetical protein
MCVNVWRRQGEWMQVREKARHESWKWGEGEMEIERERWRE